MIPSLGLILIKDVRDTPIESICISKGSSKESLEYKKDTSPSESPRRILDMLSYCVSLALAKSARKALALELIFGSRKKKLETGRGSYDGKHEKGTERRLDISW
ncbi:hypothetical protein J3458_005199 [Metarhizium acridum]|uniref:uncharacterized protein n=1 Tax=Metarhizium acridum TaxID=92637 RepID=UPI001C6B782F|nr:hypothetical protein J3458_005199 [Metarhizium acridum]